MRRFGNDFRLSLDHFRESILLHTPVNQYSTILMNFDAQCACALVVSNKCSVPNMTPRTHQSDPIIFELLQLQVATYCHSKETESTRSAESMLQFCMLVEQKTEHAQREKHRTETPCVLKTSLATRFGAWRHAVVWRGDAPQWRGSTEY